MNMVIFFLVSSAVTYGLYEVFYHYSSLIWSLNTTVPLSEWTYYVVWGAGPGQRNGVQSYVLYVLMLLGIFLSLFFYLTILRIKVFLDKNLFILFLITLTLLTANFFKTVGFSLPDALVPSGHLKYVYISCMLMLSLILPCLNNKIHALSIFVVILLYAVCIIPTNATMLTTSIYVFDPALRMIHGIPWKASFCQYDYFLSMVAAVWMKLRLPVCSFDIVELISYYSFLLVLFFFTRRYFINKVLSIYLIIILVIVRIYGIDGDIVLYLSQTPLRLDLWLLLLMVVHWKGIKHWFTGSLIGALIIFHHAFGVIYGLTYVLLVSILCAIDIMDKKNAARKVLGEYCHSYFVNMLLVLMACLFYKIFFEPTTQAMTFILKYGLGCVPIPVNSLYWYFPGMFAMVFYILWKNRPEQNTPIVGPNPGLTQEYFQTGVFMVLLAIGNSFYYYERSISGAYDQYFHVTVPGAFFIF